MTHATRIFTGIPSNAAESLHTHLQSEPRADSGCRESRPQMHSSKLGFTTDGSSTPMRAAPSTDEPGRDTSSPPAQQAHLPGLLTSSKDNSRPDSGLKDVTSPPALMAKQFASVPGLPITPADNAMALCNQSKLGPKHSPGLLDIRVTSPKCLPPEKPGGDICLTYSSPRTTSYARATQSYETAE